MLVFCYRLSGNDKAKISPKSNALFVNSQFVAFIDRKVSPPEMNVKRSLSRSGDLAIRRSASA
jgi:hypothetical protein